MDSNTSSENFNLDQINYVDNNGNNVTNNETKKKDTSETDLYLNMIANQSKVKEESEQSSSSLRLDDSDKKNSSTINSSSNNSVSSKATFQEVSFDNTNTNEKKSRTKTEDSEERTNTYSDKYREKTPVKVQLSPQEIRMKKIELLRKLSELKQKGYKLSKEYDFTSSLEDMEYEYDLLKSFANKRNGIKLYKNILLNVCSVTEFLNDKYDPFNFQLTGWSEHMSVEVDSYDDVLEELYEKIRKLNNLFS